MLNRLALSIVSFSLFSGMISLASASALAEDTCPGWKGGELIAHLSDPEVAESSGLADSWRRDDLLWTHNDSGYEPVLYLVRKSDAEVVTRVRLVGAENIDWEDMAIAPCADAREADAPVPCVYVGDIGDNLARYPRRTIYRFPEPDLSGELPAQIDIEVFDKLDYVYPDGPRDAETLLVHPTSARMYVIEKSGTGTSHVYRIPDQFNRAEDLEVEHIATLNIEGTLSYGRMITAGDISPDGSEFTLRTYLNLYVYCSDGEDFETAFSSTPDPGPQRPLTIQGEALTYDRSDGALWLTSERVPAPLIRVPPRARGDEALPPDEVEAEPAADVGLDPASPDPTPVTFPDGEPDGGGLPVDTSTPISETGSCTCATQTSTKRSSLIPALIFGLFWMNRRRRRAN